MISINNVDILVIIIFNNRVFWDRKKSVHHVAKRIDRFNDIHRFECYTNSANSRLFDSSKYINIAQNIENCCKINCFY